MKPDFDIAFLKTMKNEGGYSNRKNDVGGETVWGISRVYHPGWSGWAEIDRLKKDFPGFYIERVKAPTSKLFEMIKLFYREQFWNRFLGDMLTDQRLANEIFDTAVNMGVVRAVSFLQRSLNCLNRDQALYPDIVEDGVMGGKTLNALKALPFKDYEVLLKMMNVLQGMHCMDFMKKSSVQEENARGWFARVEIGKS